MVIGRNKDKSSFWYPLHTSRDLCKVVWVHQFSLTLGLTLQSTVEILPGLPIGTPLQRNQPYVVRNWLSSGSCWEFHIMAIPLFSQKAFEKIYNFGCLFSDNGGLFGLPFAFNSLTIFGHQSIVTTKLQFVCSLSHFLVTNHVNVLLE